jgi:membrane-bound lytic murein transglycosylase F
MVESFGRNRIRVCTLLYFSSRFELKILRLILLLFCALGLASCGNSDEPNSAPPAYTFDWPQIKSRGKLIALVDNSSTSYFIYKGRPMGFEFELLNRFANDAGIELEIKVISALDKFAQHLQNGEGDVVAANVTITPERQKEVAFSRSIIQTREVLIQRRGNAPIRNIKNLAGKEIVIRGGSSFYESLLAISAQLDTPLVLRLVTDSIDQNVSNKTLQLIDSVSKGLIDFTVADENIARVEAHLRPNLDIQTPISDQQDIAWALRISDTLLADTLNRWLTAFMKTDDFYTIYTKYFKARSLHALRVKSDYSSAGAGKISSFDPLIKKYASLLGWDWRLLAALIYTESQFDDQAEAWTGACGLMQLIPETAVGLGLDTHQFCNPEENIKAGTTLLSQLERTWLDKIPDTEERIKFVLASFNAGTGHVLDARALANKYGKQVDLWEHHVDTFLLLKSQPKFYNDPICKYGYCRGKEPVAYVQHVLEHYRHYQNLHK